MRTVTIEKDGNTYTVNPNASGGGSMTLYAFTSAYGDYPYWTSKQRPEIGDIMAGSEYEQESLSNIQTILDIKTVAEVKVITGNDNWEYNFDDDVLVYQIYDDATDYYSWRALASDFHDYPKATQIDF